MELAGGCVCHEVRVQSELWAAIAEVARRSRPEVVVLETTGIAEPWSILDGLEGLPRGDGAGGRGGRGLRRRRRGGRRRSSRGTRRRGRRSRPPTGSCSPSWISPPPEAVVALHRELAQRNPTAERASFPDDRRGDRGARALAARRRARGRRAGAAAARQRTPHAHGQLAAVAYTDAAPLLAEPLLAVVERLGPALVRAKGFVHLAGEPRRGFLERAGARTSAAPRRALGRRDRRAPSWS